MFLLFFFMSTTHSLIPPSLLMSKVFKLICGRKIQRFDDESRILLCVCCVVVLSVISPGDQKGLNLFRNKIYLQVP